VHDLYVGRVVGSNRPGINSLYHPEEFLCHISLHHNIPIGERLVHDLYVGRVVGSNRPEEFLWHMISLHLNIPIGERNTRLVHDLYVGWVVGSNRPG
jgi:hypothetical protein